MNIIDNFYIRIRKYLFYSLIPCAICRRFMQFFTCAVMTRTERIPTISVPPFHLIYDCRAQQVMLISAISVPDSSKSGPKSFAVLNN